MRTWPHFKMVFAVCAIVIVLTGAVAAASFALLYGLEEDVESVSADGEAAFALIFISASARDVELFAAEERLGMPAALRRTDLHSIDDTLTMMHDTLPLITAARSVQDARLGRQIAELRTAFLTYLVSGSDADLLAVVAGAREVRQSSEILMFPVITGTERAFDGVLAGLRDNRALLLANAIVIIPLLVGTIVWMGRKMGDAIMDVHDREATLLDANASMARRNQQFYGIYRIVTEVTETLSVKYVVETTVREVRALVHADLVILRVLDGQVLKLQGMEPGNLETEVRIPEEIVLGAGMEGRAAKRGRFLQVDATDRQTTFLDDAPLADSRSAIVVPLIVGARVVGTVSCWSHASDAFSPDDQQALEMMASQVATAIAAASLHEGSDHDASHDALTGLPNRRQLAEDIRFEYNAAVKRGRQTSVAMIDVDHFKRFNDQHGHRAGDIALEKVAAVLDGALRTDDRLYRYGGEEFLVVFDKLTAAEALEACERLRNLVALEPVLEEGNVTVTISAGIATGPEMSTDFERLIHIADAALYEAKGTGRNRVTISNDAAQEAAA